LRKTFFQPKLGLVPGNQLDLRIGRVVLVLVGRCGLVLQRFRVQRHGLARNACTALYDLIHVVDRVIGVVGNERDGQRVFDA
jgi:hypothetical protein